MAENTKMSVCKTQLTTKHFLRTRKPGEEEIKELGLGSGHRKPLRLGGQGRHGVHGESFKQAVEGVVVVPWEKNAREGGGIDRIWKEIQLEGCSLDNREGRGGWGYLWIVWV